MEDEGAASHRKGAELDSSEVWIDIRAAKRHNRMRDLKSPMAIWTKGVLFLLLGIASGVLLLPEAPSPRLAVLLAMAIWGFCRAYYFVVYV